MYTGVKIIDVFVVSEIPSPRLLSGFARYPMVGYIYKVNSTSSEEIWL